MKIVKKRPEYIESEIKYSDQIHCINPNGPYYFYIVGTGENSAIAILSRNEKYPEAFGFRYWNQLVYDGFDIKFKGHTIRSSIEKAIEAGRTVYQADTFEELCETFLNPI